MINTPESRLRTATERALQRAPTVLLNVADLVLGELLLIPLLWYSLKLVLLRALIRCLRACAARL